MPLPPEGADGHIADHSYMEGTNECLATVIQSTDFSASLTL